MRPLAKGGGHQLHIPAGGVGRNKALNQAVADEDGRVGMEEEMADQSLDLIRRLASTGLEEVVEVRWVAECEGAAAADANSRLDVTKVGGGAVYENLEDRRAVDDAAASQVDGHIRGAAALYAGAPGVLRLVEHVGRAPDTQPLLHLLSGRHRATLRESRGRGHLRRAEARGSALAAASATVIDGGRGVGAVLPANAEPVSRVQLEVSVRARAVHDVHKAALVDLHLDRARGICPRSHLVVRAAGNRAGEVAYGVRSAGTPLDSGG
mmetsp:Transcript_26839/g.71972  ORF Transcript_26839/g.71972 Transcript_26839/m.71972 type:complete len:266 (-) Transcript_26839:1732-2529(-)